MVICAPNAEHVFCCRVPVPERARPALAEDDTNSDEKARDLVKKSVQFFTVSAHQRDRENTDLTNAQ